MKLYAHSGGHSWFIRLFCAWALLVTGRAGLAVDIYAPQPMRPNPIEQTFDAGRPTGMPLYPSSPVPGHPGADPAEGRNPWSHPQRLPYEGSVEHWRVWTPHYIQPIAPFNHRTLLKNFPAQEMSGVTAAMRETWAEPIQYVVRTGPPVNAGFRDPVPVVRLKPGEAQLRFKLDPLPTGMYAVRLIAAIETENKPAWGQHPRDLIVTMSINDGPAGATRTYVLRQRGTDSFYSIGEFFFHVEDARPWKVSLGLHSDSEVELLVHNVDVHDILAETAKRAGKTRSISMPPELLEARWASQAAEKARQNLSSRRQEIYITKRLAALRQTHPDLDDKEIRALYRRRRDEQLWNMLPPKNFNFYMLKGPSLPSAADATTHQQLEALGMVKPPSSYVPAPHWWRVDRKSRYQGNNYAALTTPWRMIWPRADDKTLYYRLEDLQAQKPLPGLPLDVHPWGVAFDLDDGRRTLFYPIAEAVHHNFARVLRIARTQAAGPFTTHGDREFSHDLALLMVRLAYDLPSYIESHAINYQFAARGAMFRRDTMAHHFRRWAYQFIDWEHLAEQYDQLFPFIEGNQDLADSVGRFIKWVKTPEDVIALLDTYILQYGARETLYFRHYYNHQHSRMLANFAAIQTDPEIAEPWIQAMYERTWEYPHRYGSVEDFMYLGTQRDGTQTIGSFAYAGGGSAVGSAAPLVDEYIADGGDRRYQLSDIHLFPRVGQFPNWLLESRVAGLHTLHVGDVGGPTVAYAQGVKAGSEQMNLGWRWTQDPRFAWLVVNRGQRRTESDDDWAELRAAAATVERNPFMSNRSRVLADWGAILEGNAGSDNFRERQAARIRIGVGAGHAHSDTLDLGLWSHGLTMAGDMGARGGYGRPCSKDTITHNLVTIDKANWMGHAWTRDIADFDGVQYMNTDTLRDGHYSRQVALVENGTPYFVDFARTIGGREHSYNFHGPPEDLFETNLATGALTEADSAWMPGYVMEGEQWAADLDRDVLQATWRMAREPKVFTVPGRGKRRNRAPEPHILGKAYDAESPRKFLRVHIPGQRGLRVRSGVAVAAAYGAGRTDGDWLRRMHLTREADDGQANSLFAAVYEPYAGEPFITDVRLEGDPADATGFAAVHVRTKNGGNDLIFSDAVAPQPRNLGGDIRVHGQFAFVSRNKTGLQQASLVGGRQLALPELVIETAAAAHEARVTALDYLNNRATLDQPLAAALAGRFFEVGTPADGPRGARWSNFEVTRIEGDTLVWRKGADGGTGLIDAIKPLSAILADDREVGSWPARGATDEHVLLNLRMPTGMPEGRNRQVALRRGSEGALVSADVFGRQVLLRAEDAGRLGLAVDDRIRLYEIAIGDTFRTGSQVSLNRHDDGSYTLRTDVPCKVMFRGRAGKRSADNGRTWQALTKGGNGMFHVEMKSAGTLMLLLDK